MNIQDLNELISAIMKRGSPEYNSPSGAFLELLSKRASEEKIEFIAEACHVYTITYPETRFF